MKQQQQYLFKLWFNLELIGVLVGLGGALALNQHPLLGACLGLGIGGVNYGIVLRSKF